MSLAPATIDSLSTSSRVTSRVIGIGKRTPFFKRSDSTTLFDTRYWDQESSRYEKKVPNIIPLAHESFERAESSIENKFQIAKLSL